MNSAFILVVFGATGDLMRNKLLPALVKLYNDKRLGEKFYIVGFARRPIENEEFRKMFKLDEDFAKHLYYQQGDFKDLEKYKELLKAFREFEKKEGSHLPRLLYLATPPVNYEEILNHLHKSNLSEGENTKIIVEKPFGKDLETAIALDKKISEIFEEKQIFRVDHYLGKETVRNMVVFRFANSIFDPIWNKKYIDSVQITLAEKKGIEARGRFFDGLGMLRDVGQNHLLQLAASVVMEQPKSFSKEGFRDARASAMSAIRCIEGDGISKQVVRGQYEGYRFEKNVATDSNTETFFAIKTYFDTERFIGVPFYLRAGKKMPKDRVEISLVFHQTCHLLFKEFGCPEIGNVLKIIIQPDEGIGIRIVAKKPGARIALETVDLEFSYKERFGETTKNAYEKLLLDIFAGDQMLFNRSDELESSWDFITKILNGWDHQKSKILNYKQGRWGPKEAQELIEKDGRKWL